VTAAVAPSVRAAARLLDPPRTNTVVSRRRRRPTDFHLLWSILVKSACVCAMCTRYTCRCGSSRSVRRVLCEYLYGVTRSPLCGLSAKLRPRVHGVARVPCGKSRPPPSMKSLQQCLLSSSEWKASGKGTPHFLLFACSISVSSAPATAPPTRRVTDNDSAVCRPSSEVDA